MFWFLTDRDFYESLAVLLGAASVFFCIIQSVRNNSSKVWGILLIALGIVFYARFEYLERVPVNSVATHSANWHILAYSGGDLDTKDLPGRDEMTFFGYAAVTPRNWTNQVKH